MRGLSVVILLSAVGARALHAEEPVPDDEACRLGGRSLRLQDSLPKSKSQGNMGICYAFPATASVYRALKKEGREPKDLSEADALISLLSVEGDDVRERRTSQVLSHDPSSVTQGYIDGGHSFDMAKAIVASKSILASGKDDLNEVRALGDDLDSLVLMQGRNVSLNMLRPTLQAMRARLQKAAKGESFDLAGLKVQGRSFHGTPDAHTESHRVARDLETISLLERFDPISNAFASFYAKYRKTHPIPKSDAGSGIPGWNASLEPTLKDVFFASDYNQEAIRAFSREGYNGTDPNLIIGYLTSDWNFRRDFRNAHLAFPEVARQGPRFDLAAVKKRLVDRCDVLSKDVQRWILENLCAGIPVMDDIVVNGVESSPDGMGHWQGAYFPGTTALHAMLADGVSREDGGPYLTFANSWPNQPRSRIPLRESCRLSTASMALSSKDPVRTFGKPLRGTLTPPEGAEGSAGKH